MSIQSPQFNNKGLRGSKALSVGIGVATGGLGGGLLAASQGSPGGQILDAANTLGKFSNQEEDPSADAMRRRVDSFGIPIISQPQIGDSYNIAMNRRMGLYP